MGLHWKGVTLFSALGVRKAPDDGSKDSDLQARGSTNCATVAKRFKDVRYLFLEEVSMVSLESLSMTDTRLKQAKATNEPFGGLGVVAFGDLYQYPPVKATPTWITEELLQQHPYTKLSNLQGKMNGRQLWVHHVTRQVVMLDQQMRQAKDVQFLELLQRVRHGQATDTDYDTLTALILKPHEAPRRPIMTTQNAVRVAINFHDVQKKAIATGQRLAVVTAHDTCSKTPLKHSERLHLLDVCDNDTDGIPGYLPLLVDHQYMLRKNVKDGTAYGFVNGATMTLWGVVLHKDEPPFDRTYNAAKPPSDNIHFLTYMPSHLLFQVTKDEREDAPDYPFPAFDGLPAGVVPFETASGNFYRSDVDVRQKPRRFNKNKIRIPQRSIIRKGFQFVMATAITGYNAQGKSFDEAVVHLSQSARASDIPVDMYVLLSRLRSLAGLKLLRGFPKTFFREPRSKAMVAEMNRLQNLADEGLKKRKVPEFIKRCPLDDEDTRCKCTWCTTDEPPPEKAAPAPQKQKATTNCNSPVAPKPPLKKTAPAPPKRKTTSSCTSKCPKDCHDCDSPVAPPQKHQRKKPKKGCSSKCSTDCQDCDYVP